MKRIIFATNNIHKLKEIQDILGPEFELVSLPQTGFSGDIPEEQDTLEGNAIQKARFIYERFQSPVFADDTGLEVDALNGQPGVFSARYAGNLNEFNSESARTEANIKKLLKNLENCNNRKAKFRTVIAYVENDDVFTFSGEVKGEIIDKKSGIDGFGYDPVFKPEGFDLTFAQMPLSEKNKISHRARAFIKFSSFLKQLSNKM
jgi:XTP/dITP diphosphohydrolase